MLADGPTALSSAAADGFAWAYYRFETCCRLLRVGPLHLLRLLPIASIGPIIFLRGAVDTRGWAHCIVISCRRWLRLGLLSF
jgi:hypothetical protein